MDSDTTLTTRAARMTSPRRLMGGLWGCLCASKIIKLSTVEWRGVGFCWWGWWGWTFRGFQDLWVNNERMGSISCCATSSLLVLCFSATWRFVNWVKLIFLNLRQRPAMKLGEKDYCVRLVFNQWNTCQLSNKCLFFNEIKKSCISVDNIQQTTLNLN